MDKVTKVKEAMKSRPGKSEDEKKELKLSSIAEKLTKNRKKDDDDDDEDEEEEKDKKKASC